MESTGMKAVYMSDTITKTKCFLNTNSDNKKNW